MGSPGQRPPVEDEPGRRSGGAYADATAGKRTKRAGLDHPSPVRISSPRREFGEQLVLLVIVLLAVLPVLGLLVDGGTWYAPLFVNAAAVALVGSLSRIVTRRSWPGWVLQPLVVASTTQMIAVPATQRWGPLPGPETLAGLRDATQNLASALANDVAPIQPVTEVTAFSAACVGLLVWVLDMLCRGRFRAPALGIPLVLAPAVASSFSIENPLGTVVLACVGAAVVALLLLPRRPLPAPVTRGSEAGTRRRASLQAVRALAATVTVAAAAVAAAAAPALVVPEPERGQFPVGSRWITPGSFMGVDPLLDLSRDLRSPLSRTVLRYSAPADSSVYLRTNTISDLLAAQWRPSEEGFTPYQAGDTLAAEPWGTNQANAADGAGSPSGAPAHAPTAQEMVGTGYPSWVLNGGEADSWTGESTNPNTTEAQRKPGAAVGIDAVGYASPWVALPQDTTKVTGLDGSFAQQLSTGTLRQRANQTVEGGRYTAQLLQPPSSQQLSSSPSLKDVAQEGLDTNGEIADPASGARIDSADPLKADQDRIPEPVRTLAQRVVKDAGAQNRPDRIAAALRDHLTSAQYSYSEQAPVSSNGRSGGLDMVQRFLETKSGYCVHFASTMVLMARSEGIPARLALGYSPGTSSKQAGNVAGVEGTTFDVNSRNAHAWAELYFVNVGWVAFDPTPGRAGTTSDALVESPEASSSSAAPSTSASATPSSAAADPTRTTRDAASSAADATSTSGNAQAGSSPAAAQAPPWLWPTVGAVLAAALLLGGAWGARSALASRRTATIGAGGPGAAELAWRQAARAARHGSSAWTRPSPEAAAAWFPDGEAHDAAQRLASAVDRDRYGPSSGRAGAAPETDRAAGERLLSDLDVLRAAAEQRKRKH